MTAPCLRRIGVLGDVHGEAETLEAALSYLADLEPLDVLLCTGDIADGHDGSDPDRCWQLLQDAGAHVVRGNHDRQPQRDEQLSRRTRQSLRALPPTRRFDTSRGPLLLCHGLGTDDLVTIFPEDEEEVVTELVGRANLGTYSYILSGHTHRRMVRRLPGNGPILINAGTLQWGYERCLLTADFNEEVFAFYDIAEDGRTITPAEVVTL